MLGHPVRSGKVRFYIWKRRYFLNLKKVRKTGEVEINGRKVGLNHTVDHTPSLPIKIGTGSLLKEGRLTLIIWGHSLHAFSEPGKGEKYYSPG